MSDLKKSILQQANAAVRAGDNEGFLAFCAEDIVWTTVGADTLRGKDEVRAWMAREYVAPPQFTVHTLIAEGDHVAALGDITSQDGPGNPVANAYCDVWRFHDGKMVELNAYVIPVRR